MLPAVFRVFAIRSIVALILLVSLAAGLVASAIGQGRRSPASERT